MSQQVVVCELRDIAGMSVKRDEVPLRQADSRYSNMCWVSDCSWGSVNI